MTTGALLPKILVFSGPLILTGILQLLYNAADVIVVGRFAGSESLAAVGSTGAVSNLMITLLIGLSLGAGVTAHDRSGEPIIGTATVVSPTGNVEARSFTVVDANGNTIGTWNGSGIDAALVRVSDAAGNEFRMFGNAIFLSHNNVAWFYANYGQSGPELDVYGDIICTGRGDFGSLYVNNQRALTEADVATVAEVEAYLGIA